MSAEIADDGLALPDIRHWGKRKYHFLKRYLDMFTTAMRPKWSELHYIDLFAGAGLARIKTSGEIVQTSPMIAATLRFPFTQLHACDANPSNASALRERLFRIAPEVPATVLCGDANVVVDGLLASIPRRGSLSVTFADPFGLHLDFETVRAVSNIRSDLIILLADNMDALRNWATYYYDNPESTLDRFMGEPGWREVLARTMGAGQPKVLRERYQARLGELGYCHFAHERIQNSRGSDIYSLLYASAHPTGLKFWRKAAETDEGGQRSIPFGD